MGTASHISSRFASQLPDTLAALKTRTERIAPQANVAYLRTLVPPQPLQLLHVDHIDGRGVDFFRSGF